MPTPGIGDPYWFEWYVGLKHIVEMLNPDNGIESVIFQHPEYDTIDDVVVEYKDDKKQNDPFEFFKLSTEPSKNDKNNKDNKKKIPFWVILSIAMVLLVVVNIFSMMESSNCRSLVMCIF